MRLRIILSLLELQKSARLQSGRSVVGDGQDCGGRLSWRIATCRFDTVDKNSASPSGKTSSQNLRSIFRVSECWNSKCKEQPDNLFRKMPPEQKQLLFDE